MQYKYQNRSIKIKPINSYYAKCNHSSKDSSKSFKGLDSKGLKDLQSLYKNLSSPLISSTFKGLQIGLFSFLFTQALAQAVLAEVVLAEETLKAQRVVTTASGFEESIKDAPASVSVILGKDIPTRPARDLAEILSLTPGVSIDAATGKSGGYGISIRGMPQNYTLILVDGKRVNASPGVFTSGFNEVTTSFMPPLGAIKRIEVIRGPMSTLYGSDAIGGVVNIITKKDFDTWSSNITLDSTLQENKTFGNYYSANAFTQGPLNKAKTLGLQLRAREYFRTGVRSKNLSIIPVVTGAPSYLSGARNNIVGVSEANIFNLGGRLTFNKDSKNRYYLDIDFGNQWYNNENSLLGDASLVGGYGKNLFFSRINTILAHEGMYDVGDLIINTDTSLQYNTTLNQGRFITKDAVPNEPFKVGQSRGIRGDDVILDSKAIITTELTKTSLGGRYWFSSLVDKIVPFNDGFMNNHTAALFAESDITLSENLSLTLGLRENFNSSFGFNTSPRAYLVYSPTSYLTIKGGVGTGYKAPEINQLISGVIALTAQGTVPIYGDRDLLPESSTNFELGFDLDTKYIDFSTTIFYTDFVNRISFHNVKEGESLGAAGSCVTNKTTNHRQICTIYYNEGASRSLGAEFYLGTKDIDVLYGSIKYDLSYTLNSTKITEGSAKGLPFTDIPLHNINSSINYFTNDFGIYLRGEFKGDWFRNPNRVTFRTLEAANNAIAKNQISRFYNDFFLLHLGGNYNITKSLRINVAIYNLLNKDFTDFTIRKNLLLNNYNYIREGRRYYISLSYDF